MEDEYAKNHGDWEAQAIEKAGDLGRTRWLA